MPPGRFHNDLYILFCRMKIQKKNKREKKKCKIKKKRQRRKKINNKHIQQSNNKIKKNNNKVCEMRDITSSHHRTLIHLFNKEKY